jgi:hypothetical protein
MKEYARLGKEKLENWKSSDITFRTLNQYFKIQLSVNSPKFMKAVPEKLILDMIPVIFGVVWCVRKSYAEFH